MLSLRMPVLEGNQNWDVLIFFQTLFLTLISSILNSSSTLISLSLLTVVDPQRKLHDEIKMIGLHGHVADGFMWPLLKITRGHDHIHMSSINLIEKQFDDEDKEGLLNLDKNLFPQFFFTNKKKDQGKKKRSESLDSLFEFQNRLKKY